MAYFAVQLRSLNAVLLLAACSPQKARLGNELNGIFPGREGSLISRREETRLRKSTDVNVDTADIMQRTCFDTFRQNFKFYFRLCRKFNLTGIGNIIQNEFYQDCERNAAKNTTLGKIFDPSKWNNFLKIGPKPS